MRRPSGKLLLTFIASILVGYVFSYLMMVVVLASDYRNYGATLHIVAVLAGMVLIFVLDKPLDLKTFDWPEPRPDEAERQSTGQIIWDYMTTVDHKKIGIMYLLTAVVFFIIGGIEALLHPPTIDCA